MHHQIIAGGLLALAGSAQAYSPAYSPIVDPPKDPKASPTTIGYCGNGFPFPPKTPHPGFPTYIPVPCPVGGVPTDIPDHKPTDWVFDPPRPKTTVSPIPTVISGLAIDPVRPEPTYHLNARTVRVSKTPGPAANDEIAVMSKVINAIDDFNAAIENYHGKMSHQAVGHAGAVLLETLREQARIANGNEPLQYSDLVDLDETTSDFIEARNDLVQTFNDIKVLIIAAGDCGVAEKFAQELYIAGMMFLEANASKFPKEIHNSVRQEINNADEGFRFLIRSFSSEYCPVETPMEFTSPTPASSTTTSSSSTTTSSSSSSSSSTAVSSTSTTTATPTTTEKAIFTTTTSSPSLSASPTIVNGTTSLVWFTPSAWTTSFVTATSTNSSSTATATATATGTTNDQVDVDVSSSTAGKTIIQRTGISLLSVAAAAWYFL